MTQRVTESDGSQWVDAKSYDALEKKKTPDLGRIGALAEAIRSAARAVTSDMSLSPGGDEYLYRGTTFAVENLVEAIIDLENFQAGWVK